MSQMQTSSQSITLSSKLQEQKEIHKAVFLTEASNWADQWKPAPLQVTRQYITYLSDLQKRKKNSLLPSVLS